MHPSFLKWHPSPSGGAVLVADDHQDANEMLAVLIELSGLRVLQARDGQQAVALAEEHLPAVALLDIAMPILDGYEVARRIRAHPRLQHTLLAALTGQASEDHVRRSREAGMHFHLVKPVDPFHLSWVLGLPAGERPQHPSPVWEFAPPPGTSAGPLH
ncbi:MAG: response regulator [Ramlibacter sp.]